MVEQRAAVVLFSKLTFISTVSCCCHQRTSQGWVSESLECWADVNIRRQPSVHIWYNCGLIMNFFFLLLQFPVLLPIPCLTAVHPWCNVSFQLRVEISWTAVLRYLQLKCSPAVCFTGSGVGAAVNSFWWPSRCQISFLLNLTVKSHTSQVGSQKKRSCFIVQIHQEEPSRITKVLIGLLKDAVAIYFGISLSLDIGISQ